uniref:Uncharacterized protein n=1 Tax=Podoviridae sp. ctG4L18 TaxID=2825234 RepID=A0A8S5UP39_9CAUD|nr:MAG TPA: hypothetical protein [Podoviridae sp. ctG4L18]
MFKKSRLCIVYYIFYVHNKYSTLAYTFLLD